MRKRVLPNSGLEVSRIGLGTLTWGRPGTDEDAAAQLRSYAEAGGNFVTTATVYGNGRAEEVLGAELATSHRRDDFVVLTKAGMIPGTTKVDASCERMLAELEESLRRLRTGHVDIWQVHAWDWTHPLEETLEAFDKAVSSGKARSVGLSNYCGWQTAKAATIQDVGGRARPVTTEVEYSLLQRGVEREVLPAAVESGIGVLPWAPLGRGVLTGKYRAGIPENRRDSKYFQWYVQHYATDDRCGRIVEEVVRCAEELAVTPAAVALSWVRDRLGVVAPLVGAKTAAQLAESLTAERLELPEEMSERLEMISAPARDYPERQVGGGGSTRPKPRVKPA
ncbi:aldo/keto reductase [Lentzea sp. NPDC059081]|uniref:aldo/keto reductase n=1 Tax=Lentzea sp. NPDC059081 TaxID=3346719 RepID=UPI0036AADE13